MPPLPPAKPGEFDRGAAAATLGRVKKDACGDAAGPTGVFHVKVVFAPDGSVSEAIYDRGYSDASTALASTPRGDCVLAVYRSARVPPFNGTPVTVGRMFTLE